MPEQQVWTKIWLSQSINWRRHMKDPCEIDHLTKFNAFMMNKDQLMVLETWFKIHTKVFNFVTVQTASPKPYKLLNVFIIPVLLFKMGKHSDFNLTFFLIVDRWHYLFSCHKTDKKNKSLYGLGDAILDVTFIWILNHVSKSITWSLFNLKSSNFVKWPISTRSFR